MHTKTTLRILFLVGLVALSSSLSLKKPPSKPNPSQSSSRRSVLHSTMTIAAAAALSGQPTSAQASTTNTAATAFVGTYTDPINHPGGTRTLRLVGEAVGSYQLAEVVGGGGRGEPDRYVLPAVLYLSTRSIVIDFSVAPKNGPKDFAGVLTEQGDIRFVRDGNVWPRQKE